MQKICIWIKPDWSLLKIQYVKFGLLKAEQLRNMKKEKIGDFIELHDEFYNELQKEFLCMKGDNKCKIMIKSLTK